VEDERLRSDGEVIEKPNEPWLYGLCFAALGVIYVVVGFLNIAAEYGWTALVIGGCVVVAMCGVFAPYKLRAIAAVLGGYALAGFGFMALFAYFWGY
jgi:hypothetical protein